MRITLWIIKIFSFSVNDFYCIISLSAASAVRDSRTDISANDNQELILEESISDDVSVNDDEELILEDNGYAIVDSFLFF